MSYALVRMLAALVLSGCASTLSSPSAPGCSGAPIQLPILSNAGAVIIPVEVDGMSAAAEITPRSSATYLTSTDGLDLPRYDDVRIGGLVGSAIGYRTRLHTLRLGATEIDGLYVTVHEEQRRPSIDGRRVMMTIGSDLLRNDQVLMDLPNRRLVLSTASTCPAPFASFVGPATSTPLRDGDNGEIDVVDARLDDRPVTMEINLSSNDTIISQSTASALGISDAELASDPSVRMGSTKGYLGRRHRFDSLRIAGFTVSRPRIAILPDITYNVLGLDFFQNKLALFDFRNHSLTFQETGTSAASRSSLFSGVVVKNADTSVSESPSSR